MTRVHATVHDYGDQALLLEFAGTAEVLAWCEAMRRARVDGVVDGVIDVVPASRTVLLELSDPRHQGPVRAQLGTLDVELDEGGFEATGDRGADVTIDVVYDGEDLDEVAHLSGLTRDGVITAHTAAPMRVAFVGFAPGFGYLVGGDERLHVPRRGEPRTRVPAGSVGLAGEFSGVYPRESPGGWQLIGRTEAALWDVDRDPPALLSPGTWVRFRAIG